MTAFVNGEQVEIKHGDEWIKAQYVGPHPRYQNSFVVMKENHMFDCRSSEGIRKAKVKKEGWIIIWSSHGIARPGGDLWETEERAEKYAKTEGTNYFGTSKVEWYE